MDPFWIARSRSRVANQMLSQNSKPSADLLRNFLILGRVSNLPTVWSNCLAGALLGGGAGWVPLVWLIVASTLLYVGGMFLNDAFDLDFDRQHRKERPIPSGKIPLHTVWTAGIAALATGFVMMALLGRTTAILTLFLITSIIVYNAVHKVVVFSPVLMALCRFFLFLAAASIGFDGVTGQAVWAAIVLATYVVGLSYVARSESTRGALKYWPCYLMAAPLVLAWLINQGSYKSKSLALSLVLILWVIRSLRTTFWSSEKNIGRTVSGLLAGIVLVDLLSTLGANNLGIVFLGLFLLSLFFQRFIPAT
ncbi:MAG: UbiA prenyltransferase [Verrucomicrobiales bacterium]|nr:UbiA prenyltransferase [Verrucomicrobiales bacterium]